MNIEPKLRVYRWVCCVAKQAEIEWAKHGHMLKNTQFRFKLHILLFIWIHEKYVVFFWAFEM